MCGGGWIASKNGDIAVKPEAARSEVHISRAWCQSMAAIFDVLHDEAATRDTGGACAILVAAEQRNRLKPDSRDVF